MSEYKDLQNEAKKLGLKFVGISKKDLARSIKGAKNQDTGRPEPDEEAPEVEKGKKDEEPTAAIVRKGKHEIRRYTLDIHGENFAKLADGFANSKDREGFSVELIKVKSGIICPDCGATIYT